MRKFLFVAAVGLMSLNGSVRAAPIDLLPGNPDLAIYLKKFPLLPPETAIYLISGSGATIWGSLATGGCRYGPCEIDVETIPIPPALPLLGAGLIMLVWIGRSRKQGL